MLERRQIYALALVILVTSPASAGPAPKKEPPAMALIVVNADYDAQGPRMLPNAPRSAADLGKAFQKCGYQTLFVAGPKTAARLDGLVTAGSEIRRANNGSAIEHEVEKWMDTVAANPPPLAVLVLVGHGVQRGDDAQLLGQEDTVAR